VKKKYEYKMSMRLDSGTYPWRFIIKENLTHNINTCAQIDDKPTVYHQFEFIGSNHFDCIVFERK